MVAVARTPQLNIQLDDTEGDALDAWLVAVTGRVNLQADIGWPGMQDGYAAAGASDNANPFAFLWWILGPVITSHCDDCLVYAAGSPYNAPGSGGNELDATPGDGHTVCGAGCKCFFAYKPAGQLETEAVAAGWAQWLGGPQNVAALSAGPDNSEAMYTIGAQVAAAGGDIGLEPLAPEEYIPGGAPSGGVGAAMAAAGGDVGPLEPISEKEFARYPGMVTPSELPYMQMPPAEPPLSALMNPFAGIPAQQTIPFPTLTDDNLSDQQKAALDAFRVSVDAWDAVRGALPEAPAFFSDTLGDFTGEGLPDLALMTPEQRSALYQLWDALALWNDAASGGDDGQQFAERGYRFSNPYPRQARGRFGFGGPGRHGGDAGAGGGRRIEEAQHALERAKSELAAAQGEVDRWRAMPARARPADQEDAIRTRYGNASRAVREAATALDVAHGGTGVEIQYLDTALRSGREAIHTVFGRDLSSRELVDLAGAHPGDRIMVHPIHNGFEASAAGPSIMRKFDVRTESDGTITLHDHYARNLHERTTQSGETIIRGMQAAERIGVDRITCSAARSTEDDFNGYNTWPKLGFDGLVPYHVIGAARAAFGHAISKVSDILTKEGGRKWWKENGDTFEATFSFHQGSYSRRVYDKLVGRQASRGSEPTTNEEQ